MKPTETGFYWLKQPDAFMDEVVYVAMQATHRGKPRPVVRGALGGGWGAPLAAMPEDCLWSPLVSPWTSEESADDDRGVGVSRVGLQSTNQERKTTK